MGFSKTQHKFNLIYQTEKETANVLTFHSTVNIDPSIDTTTEKEGKNAAQSWTSVSRENKKQKAKNKRNWICNKIKQPVKQKMKHDAVHKLVQSRTNRPC